MCCALTLKKYFFRVRVRYKSHDSPRSTSQFWVGRTWKVRDRPVKLFIFLMIVLCLSVLIYAFITGLCIRARGATAQPTSACSYLLTSVFTTSPGHITACQLDLPLSQRCSCRIQQGGGRDRSTIHQLHISLALAPPAVGLLAFCLTSPNGHQPPLARRFHK